MTTEYEQPEGEIAEILKEFDPHGRSIFDFTDQELEDVIEKKVFPEGTTLTGIEDDEHFDKLWRYRTNPEMLAKLILKKRLGGRVLKEPIAVKEKRYKLKELELNLKLKKQESAMHYQKVILDRLDKIELLIRMIMKKLDA